MSLGVETMGIGELSRRTGLSISAIRFYGDRGLLPPIEVDPSTGYRRFHVDQVIAGRLIRDLRSIDLPLDAVAEALELSPSKRHAVVERHVANLETATAAARIVASQLDDSVAIELQVRPTQPDAALLATTLERVVSVAGSDPAAPHLMGVLIERSTGSLRIAATDRYRLAVRDLSVDAGVDEFAAVVAAVTMREWVASLAEIGHEAIRIEMSDDELRLVHDQGELAAPALPIQFPDYEPIMLAGERSRCASVQAPRDVLVGAFERFRGSDRVELVVADCRVSLGEPGGSSEYVEAVATGAGAVVLDPSFVLDALTVSIGHELIVELGEPAEPVVFRSADDGTFTSMLMPILLDSVSPLSETDRGTVGA